MESRQSVASHRIADIIRESILDGTLAPGSRIRQEEIAAQFGVSRLPVREALRILESDGLATLVANTGAWVSTLDMDECSEIYKMRERLEPLILGESIPNLTDADIAEISDLADAITASDGLEEFLLLDRRFHLSTYKAAKMPSLLTWVERLWNTTQHYRRAYTAMAGTDRRWVIDYEHRLLADAIAQRDADEACRIIQGHIRRTRKSLEEHPEIFVPTAR